MGNRSCPAGRQRLRDLRGLDRLAIDFASRRILFDIPAGAL